MMENREFYFQKDGLNLHCKLEFPQGVAKEKLPLVILQHGLTGHMEERHIIAVKDALLGAGCCVLRTELYGHGKSDGEFRNHTIWEWVSEMLYIVQQVRGWDFVSKLFMGGHSQGGLTSLLAGGMAADCIDGLLLLSPAVVIRDACRDGTMFGSTFDPKNLPEEVLIHGHIYNSNYVRTAAMLPVEECIHNYSGPVLIVHGDADDAVPFRYAEEIQAQYENAELVAIPGDTHCYDYHLDLVQRAVAGFVAKESRDE